MWSTQKCIYVLKERMTAIKLIFTKLMLAQQLFANSYTRYLENLTYNLAQQYQVTNGCGLHTRHSFGLFHKKKHLRKHYKNKAKVSQWKYDTIPAPFPVLSANVRFLSPESVFCLKPLMSVLEGHWVLSEDVHFPPPI